MEHARRCDVDDEQKSDVALKCKGTVVTIVGKILEVRAKNSDALHAGWDGKYFLRIQAEVKEKDCWEVRHSVFS